MNESFYFSCNFWTVIISSSLPLAMGIWKCSCQVSCLDFSLYRLYPPHSKCTYTSPPCSSCIPYMSRISTFRVEFFITPSSFRDSFSCSSSKQVIRLCYSVSHSRISCYFLFIFSSSFSSATIQLSTQFSNVI